MSKVILESVVGSTLHGTAVDDGLEDLDLMAVCIEDASEFIGFNQQDTWVTRTKPDGVRSEAGDIDRSAYGLRKYLTLALKGNPTVLLALFAPREAMRVLEPEGEQLQTLAQSIVSKQVYQPFRGYMDMQQKRLIGSVGQKNCTRPELVERYGYDTKYAGHIVRLGLQGVELLYTGRITLPMTPDERYMVRKVRTGGFSLGEVSDICNGLKDQIDRAHQASELPETPDRDKVEAWMIKAYLAHWNSCT